MNPHSFTGRGKRRETRRSVFVAERVARSLITIGGVGTILAVSLILVFLVWIVLPLFSGARFDSQPPRDLASGELAPGGARPLATGVDEYRTQAFALDEAGVVRAWRLDNGELLREERPFGDARPTAISTPGPDGAYYVGFADGSARRVALRVSTSFVEPDAASELGKALAGVPRATWEKGVAEARANGQHRLQQLAIEVGEPIDLGAPQAVVAIDAAQDEDGARVLALQRGPRLVLADAEENENAFTGEVALSLTVREVSFAPRTDGAEPARALVQGAGTSLLVVWNDGYARRYDARDPEAVALAEDVDLVDGDAQLTAAGFLVGRTTLVVGDSRGRLRAWFPVRPESPVTPDGLAFVRAHELAAGGAPVRALASSVRGRSIAAGTADGRVSVHYVTSHKELLSVQIPGAASIDALAIAPKDDGLVAWSGARLASWRVELLHPEATIGALFRPVWYESYASPEHVWQSSSGTDDFEAKLGLVPLVFGTLKATLYSMLFGVPLAILAAIYTSQFLHPRLRTPLKSAVEMMASLPSVVLGFLAALVFAPLVEQIVPEVLTGLFTIPLALLFGARMWMLLPAGTYVRLGGLPRFLAIAAMLPIGLLLAVWLGPVVERALFAGDVMAWLNGARGEAWGGWFLLLVPLAAALVWLLFTRAVEPWWLRVSRGWERPVAARMELVRFAVSLFAVLALAYALARALGGAGFDPRGGVLDTYVQRNALIVGVVMGFAVVPIIYTLAEDALSSVPGHLRLASLGSGATPWQTAMRVIVPTAMSGLFSAVMVGLGRAVGETMIVLMATGNTPIMSWNVFDGFRTLSANIAVELPEAVKESTHYRTLFLAGLVLFAMTFVLNTVAEVVRQRFRKRAFQL